MPTQKEQAQRIEQKASLLKKYKALKEELYGAESTFEEELIIQERNTLATQIKTLSQAIRDYEESQEA
jgi:hypothetical protein